MWLLCFSFADNTLNAGMYYIMAFKENYMHMINNVYKDDTTYLYLNEGDMNYGGGTYDGRQLRDERAIAGQIHA